MKANKRIGIIMDHKKWESQLIARLVASDGKYLDGFPQDTQDYIKRNVETGIFTLTDEGDRVIVRVKS